MFVKNNNSGQNIKFCKKSKAMKNFKNGQKLQANFQKMANYWRKFFKSKFQLKHFKTW